jgi:hypothetical protein
LSPSVEPWRIGIDFLPLRGGGRIECRCEPEATPNLDALLPAFVEQWLAHAADMLARPERYLNDAILARIPRVHTANFGAAQANAVNDKLKKQAAEAMQKARAPLDMRLFETVSVNLKNVPLQQAVKQLAQTTGLRITPDFAALDEAKFNLNRPVSLNVDNATIHAALRQLLDPLQLSFETRNGVVLITPSRVKLNASNAERRAEAAANEAQRIFEIADRLRRSQEYDVARRLFQQVHLLAPTTLHGRMAIVRIIEIEERMRDVSEEQGGDNSNRPHDPDQVFRDLRDRTIPLGLVEVSY